MHGSSCESTLEEDVKGYRRRHRPTSGLTDDVCLWRPHSGRVAIEMPSPCAQYLVVATEVGVKSFKPGDDVTVTRRFTVTLGLSDKTEHRKDITEGIKGIIMNLDTSKTSFRDVGDRRSVITLLITYGPTQRALIQTRRGEIDYGEHDSHGFVKSPFLTR